MKEMKSLNMPKGQAPNLCKHSSGQTPNLCKHSSGQALLIVVLVMAVALTVGLAVISRSVTDIRISQQEEESARVFSAAEAGLEQAFLTKPAGQYQYTVGDFTATVTGGTLAVGSEFNFGGGKFAAGDTQTLWLVSHTGDQLDESGDRFPASGTINICWGDNVADKSAIEAILIYKDSGGNFKVAKGAYDADSSRRASNGFDLADDIGGVNCGNLAFREELILTTKFNLPSGSILYALRLRLLYNTQPQSLAVRGSTDFPVQGTCYESTAAHKDRPSITRKIRQCQLYKAPVGIFDYVLYSEGDLKK